MSTEGKAPRTPLSIRKKACFVIATVALMLLLVFVAGEILVRLLRPHYTVEDRRAEALLYEGSIFCRHVLRREGRVIRDIPHPEDMAIAINEKGFRGPPFPAHKPAGAKRVIFLGGSSVFGFRLKGPGADWPARVERRLRAAGFANVECINAATPGHATFDSLGRLYGELHLYEPDIIVLYQSFNDLHYFTRLRADRPLMDIYRPYVERRDPRIQYIGWWDRLLCHSQLYTKVRTRYFEGKLRRPWERKPAGAQNAEGTPTEIDGKQPLPDGFDQFRLNVSLLCEAAHETGARVLLVTQARLAAKGREGLIDGPHLTSLEMDEPTLVDTFERCDAILRDVAKQKNAVFLDAAAEMSGEEKCFLDLIHLTDIGADRLADIVAAGMDPLLREGAE